MIESTSKILLCSNHNDQWAHYRNGRNIYPKIRAPTGGTVIGYPVKVSITPTGYKIIETNIRQLPNTYHQNKLQPTQNWAKLATGNITCYKARRLESMWKNGTDLLIGTDGGLKSNIGTTGVVIESSNDPKANIKAKSAETAPLYNLHSTREELRAILSAEIILDKMGSIWGKKKIDITIVSDSTSALHFVDKTTIPAWKKRDVMGPEADILMAIDRLKTNNNNIKRTFQWVKSHQSEDEPMTPFRRVNDIADDLATECRHEVNDDLAEAPRKIFYPDSIAAFHIKGLIISRDLKVEVHRALNDRNLREFLQGKYHWNNKVFESIDWRTVKKCLKKNLRPTQQLLLSLFIDGNPLTR